MTAQLRLVPPSPSLDARLAARFKRIDELRAELQREEAALTADRALWMAENSTYGISRDALRKAVRV